MKEVITMSKLEYKIERNVPHPRRASIPFKEMRVGDSIPIMIPNDKDILKFMNSMHQKVFKANKTYPDRKYSCYKMEGRLVRIYRIQ
jgi:hypothetical protein